MATVMMGVLKKTAGTGLLATAKPPSDRVINALATEDQVLLTKLLTEPADYVHHPEFNGPSCERDLFGATAKLVSRAGTRFVSVHDAVTSAVSTGERRPALPIEQERHLFLRFNYARMRVKNLLMEFCGKKLTGPVTRQLLGWGHRVLACRSVIVRLNMPLVLAMAKRTRLTNIDFNEMVSEGNMALLRSVEKFDCSRGFKFSTYSCRAILKAFSRVAMRVSRYRGQFPTEFDPAMERSDHIDHLRQGVESDCVDELKSILVANLAGLSEVETKVIKERFALDPLPTEPEKSPKTLEQVGNIIGVTKERVRQIQNNALKKIRVTLEDRYLAA